MTDNPNTRPVLPGEDVKSVSMREFEQRNQELKEMFSRELSHEREMREEITAKLEEARKLNATEIFRRLDELNHAHATAMENWARSLPRELFEQWKEDYDKWREEVGTKLTIIAPHTEQIGAMTLKLATLDTDVNNLRSVGSHVLAVDTRVVVIEKIVSRATGAAILLGLMGMAGVVAFIMGLMRVAGAVK